MSTGFEQGKARFGTSPLPVGTYPGQSPTVWRRVLTSGSIANREADLSNGWYLTMGQRRRLLDRDAGNGWKSTSASRDLHSGTNERAMTPDRAKRENMSLEELASSNMWEIAAIVELLEKKGLCTEQDLYHIIGYLRR
mgnify:CR=1 FL=1